MEFENIAEKIIGCAYKVYNTMGYGFLESVYEKCLLIGYKTECEGVIINKIAFYPTPSGIEAFKKELSGYKWAKGSVQFPIDKAVPYDLVEKIVKFRVKENMEGALQSE